MVDVLELLCVCFFLRESRKTMLHSPVFANVWKPGEEISPCSYRHPDNGSDFLTFVTRTPKGEMVLITYWL